METFTYDLLQWQGALLLAVSHSRNSYCADVKLLEDQAFVEGVQEQVNGALLEYTLSTYPQFQEKFSQLVVRLPELRSLSTQAEDYLCYMHLSGEVPCNNLLIEMLHAKRACV